MAGAQWSQVAQPGRSGPGPHPQAAAVAYASQESVCMLAAAIRRAVASVIWGMVVPRSRPARFSVDAAGVSSLPFGFFFVRSLGDDVRGP